MASVLAGRRIVLGVCGGIAAYKAVELCRRLVDTGASVAPVLTADAARFVTPLTFSALATEPVRTSMWEAPEPIPHVTLGRWADVVVVAPATARLLALQAHGIPADLLNATLLATRAPVVVCPAMHTEMWEHAAVRANVAVLRERGVSVVAPEVGRLAGGDVGAGRLADLDAVLAAVEQALAGRPADLAGVRVLVTAGGTREPIDAVRFIGNRSSGKQGHAVAAEAAARGATVTLVTAATAAVPTGVDAVAVETAADMEREVLVRAPDADIVVMAAAVADFRPKAAATTKLAKADGVPELVLEPTPDILSALGARKPSGQVLVGFAAETGDVRAGAARKLRDKRLDLVVGNDVSAPGAGFDADTNAAILLGADGSEQTVGVSDKREVAKAVLDAVTRLRRSTP